MTETGGQAFFNSEARGDWVRLRTLVLLRWVAITGQSAAVLTADRMLGFQLPLTACALVISASVSINLVAYLVHPAEKRLSERGTLFSLFFDLAQLGALLMLTGGLNNPFAVLILAPVTISATALKLRSTILLGVAALAMIPVLAVSHLPLVQADGSPLEVPQIYAWGILAALATGVVFLSLYARRVTVESYRMSEALSATQIALAREQRLAAIGGIAAAAAHELGTPLATIKLVAKELERDLAEQPQLAEDAALIRQEAERCGEIMAGLSRTGREDADFEAAPISAVVEEAAAPHRSRGKRLVIRYDGLPIAAVREAQPTVLRRPEIIHGLRNLIQNAVDFSRQTVWVDIAVEDDTIRISVGDDGPGFGLDLLPRLGEPYVTSRARGSRNAKRGGYEGMGLGLFIARTLLERTGARLSFSNGSDSPDRTQIATVPAEIAHPPGAIIEIAWARGALVPEAPRMGWFRRRDRLVEAG
ncbi:MAG: sensor histidine kinase RegB [Paracoccaceae bacterium]